MLVFCLLKKLIKDLNNNNNKYNALTRLKNLKKLFTQQFKIHLTNKMTFNNTNIAIIIVFATTQNKVIYKFLLHSKNLKKEKNHQQIKISKQKFISQIRSSKFFKMTRIIK